MTIRAIPFEILNGGDGMEKNKNMWGVLHDKKIMCDAGPAQKIKYVGKGVTEKEHVGGHGKICRGKGRKMEVVKKYARWAKSNNMGGSWRK